MGLPRLIYDQFITAASMLTASSLANAVLTTPEARVKGSATLNRDGPYTGTDERTYVVTITTPGTGEIGSAAFRWSDDNDATTIASGVTTSTSPITLNRGVKIWWNQGGGQDVYEGDQWKFKVLFPYGVAKLIDSSRETAWRSAAGIANQVATLAADFGSGVTKNVKAVVIGDHTIPSDATTRIQSSTTSTFAATPVNEVITWAADKMLHYVTGDGNSYRYWRLHMTVVTAPTAGYLAIGTLRFDNYIELSKAYRIGFTEGSQRLGLVPEHLARGRAPVAFLQRFWEIEWGRLQDAGASSDIQKLLTMWESARHNDVANGEVIPWIFNQDSADPAKHWLVQWVSDYVQRHVFLDRYDVPTRFDEVVKS